MILQRLVAFWLPSLLAAVASTGSGCGLGDSTIDEVAPDSIPDSPSYSEHVRPILNFYCASCHSKAEDKEQRKRECEDDVDYSTYQGSVAGFCGIEKTVFKRSTMPPGAARRIPLREQALLRRWKTAGYPE